MTSVKRAYCMGCQNERWSGKELGRVQGSPTPFIHPRIFFLRLDPCLLKLATTKKMEEKADQADKWSCWWEGVALSAAALTANTIVSTHLHLRCVCADLRELASALTVRCCLADDSMETPGGNGKHICLGSGWTDASRMIGDERNRAKLDSLFIPVYWSMALCLSSESAGTF